MSGHKRSEPPLPIYADLLHIAHERCMLQGLIAVHRAHQGF